MSGSKIELQSGATIERIPLNGYDERWDMNNPTLSTIYITIDLTNCKNVVVEGYDDEIKITECLEPMTEGTLFVIQKNPPFVFNIGFSAREEPMPVEKQMVHLAPK